MKEKRMVNSCRVFVSIVMVVIFIVVEVLAGCRGAVAPAKKPSVPRVKAMKKEPRKMGYTIQTGAFVKVENAVNLMNSLREQGFDATYFKSSDGLYKVRFGNFTEREDAVIVAAILKSMKVIEDFYVVMPEDYALSKREAKGVSYIREEIVKTAHSFIGVPYLWGGTSTETGFDCSGLTMTVYQLNGVDLPRTAAEQFQAGEPVDRDELEKGDLVFFYTTGRGKVTHVGIYIGDNRFIHAPRRGKRISIEKLDNSYFAQRYLGARRYIS